MGHLLSRQRLHQALFSFQMQVCNDAIDALTAVNGVTYRCNSLVNLVGEQDESILFSFSKYSMFLCLCSRSYVDTFLIARTSLRKYNQSLLLQKPQLLQAVRSVCQLSCKVQTVNILLPVGITNSYFAKMSCMHQATDKTW